DRFHLSPVRVARPYDAMHLDWYLDIFNPTEENNIYITPHDGPGSWGRQWLSDFWYRFQEDKQAAFEHLFSVPPVSGDLDNSAFLISWCLQYGQGCEPDQAASLLHLRRAIPNTGSYHHDYYWKHEREWTNMIYNNDFSGLGWQ